MLKQNQIFVFIQTKIFSSGKICMLLAGLFFASMAISIKELSIVFSSFEILLIRSIFSLIFLSILMFYQRISFLGNNRISLIVRGILGALAASCYFYSLGKSPAAEVVVLFRSTALFVPFVAYIFLKEKFSLQDFILSVFGFIGVVLIMKPQDLGFQLGYMITIFGAFLSSLAWTCIRHLASKEHAYTIVFYFLICSSLIGIVASDYQAVDLDSNLTLHLISLCIFGFLGQIFFTKSYTLESAAKVTPLTYFEVFAFVVLNLIFHFNPPDIYLLLGMALIVYSSVKILLRKI